MLLFSAHNLAPDLSGSKDKAKQAAGLGSPDQYIGRANQDLQDIIGQNFADFF